MYLILLLLALVPFQLVAVDPAQPMPTPLMRVVEPGTAKVGDEILVTGDNLGKQYVAEIFLTAGKESHKVQVLSQEDKAVKFIVPAGVKFAELSIGRVITAPRMRGRGLGRELVQRGIAAAGPVPIRIGAQAHLEAFYGELGFQRASDVYDEDGIPHIEMLRPASP